MKKTFVLLAMLVFSFASIAAQEEDMSNWDIDSFFGEPLSETTVEENPAEENPGDSVSLALGLVKKRGLTFGAFYEFQGWISPGWDTAPWFFDGKEEYSWGYGGNMYSSFSLDAQISDVFRVLTVFSFNVPKFEFSLGDFFFDYNLLDAAFIRAGKYEQTWGISPNFKYTNLLSRVPNEKDYGTSYIFKTDIPIGIGGFQMLVLTRERLMEGIYPTFEDLGYGGKYNLAFRWADFDLGVFYQENMALRSFLSIKTTIMNTELYNEWLVAVNTHSDNRASFATNIGFIRNFWGNKLTLNGEFFYNGEKDAKLYVPETSLQEEKILPFIEDITLALNALYRFGGKINTRFFIQTLYAPAQASAQVIPGFRFAPFSNVEFYLAAPMALGKKTGYYYQNTADPYNRKYSIMLLITVKGNVEAGFYY